MNIAIISPNKNSYSETFIQAQKKGLEGNVYYYYDGIVPTKLEGEGSIILKYAYIKKALRLFSRDIRSQSLRQSLKKNKIDVVLAHYGPTGEAVTNICESLKIPLVVHFHGYDSSIRDVINRYNRYQEAFKIAHKVIAVSRVMENDLEALGCPKNKIVYNPCAPDEIFNTIQATFKSQQFISMGRFTDKKAQYYTILAFSKVLIDFPEAKLVLGGDGELLNTCKNLVKYLGIEHAVSFSGIMTRQEFIEILAESLAFVQHSIIAISGDKEGTPVAVLEASSAGLPIIATQHAGIPDVIIHNETGLLVKEHDVSTMAQYMLQLLNDKMLAQNLGSKGKIRIEKSFNMANHLNVLQNVLLDAKNLRK